MSVIDLPRADFMREEDIVLFEDSAAKFFEAHAPAERVAKWRKDHVVEREMWREAGAAGLLCLAIPEAYGGAGGDYRHEVVFMETMARKGIDGFGAAATSTRSGWMRRIPPSCSSTACACRPPI